MNWKIKDIIYLIGLYLSSIILTSIIEIVFEYLILGKLVDRLDVPNYIYISGQMIDAAFMIGIVIYFIKKKYKSNIAIIGLHFDRTYRNILIGISGGMIIFLVVIPLDIFIVRLIGEGPIDDLSSARILNAESIYDYLTIFVSLCVLSPISYEIFFRGFIYNNLKTNLNTITAIILTNILFWSFFVSPWWFIQIFAIGVLLTLLFEYSNSLISPIIANSIFYMIFIVSLRL